MTIDVGGNFFGVYQTGDSPLAFGSSKFSKSQVLDPKVIAVHLILDGTVYAESFLRKFMCTLMKNNKKLQCLWIIFNKKITELQLFETAKILLFSRNIIDLRFSIHPETAVEADTLKFLVKEVILWNTQIDELVFRHGGENYLATTKIDVFQKQRNEQNLQSRCLQVILASLGQTAQIKDIYSKEENERENGRRELIHKLSQVKIEHPFYTYLKVKSPGLASMALMDVIEGKPIRKLVFALLPRSSMLPKCVIA